MLCNIAQQRLFDWYWHCHAMPWKWYLFQKHPAYGSNAVLCIFSTVLC